MGGKGGSPGDVTSKAYTSSLPEWISAPHIALSKRAQLESAKNYIGSPYMDVAPLTTPELLSVIDKAQMWQGGEGGPDPIGLYGLSNLQEAAMIPQGLQSIYGNDWRAIPPPVGPYLNQSYMDAEGNWVVGGDSSLLRSSTDGSDGSASSTRPPVATGRDSEGRGGILDSFGTYGGYMSPYQKNVTNVAIDRAKSEAEMAEKAASAQSVASGAFGSYRSDLESLGRESDLQSRISEIEALGAQGAYENAQQQFERDNARRMQAQMFNEQQRMAAAGHYVQTGTLADVMAANMQGRAYDRTREFERAGATMRDWQQVKLDALQKRYWDKVNYPWTQMGREAGIIAGVPNLLSTQTTTRAPSVGLPAQMMGLGLGAVGLNQAMPGIFGGG